VRLGSLPSGEKELPAMRDLLRPALLAAGLALAATPAAAFVGQPYAMPNGSGVASGGTFNYWDVTNNGVGDLTTDGAPIFGSGKLTDGVTTTQIWNADANLDGTGVYVGWNATTTPDLAVTFIWPIPICLVAACFQFIDGVTIWMDNSGIGGVAAPTEIRVNGQAVGYTPPAFGSAGPVAIDLTPLVLSSYAATLELSYGDEWIFVSEVEWATRFVSAAPTPAAVGLFAAGLLGLAALRRRRSR
jgi:hypothetical protein